MSPLLRVEFEVPSRTGAVSQIMYVPYASVENTLCVVTLLVLITRRVLLQSLLMEAIKLVVVVVFLFFFFFSTKIIYVLYKLNSIAGVHELAS